MEVFVDKSWGNLPDVDCAVHRSTLKMQTEMAKYSKRITKELLIKRGALEVTERPKGAARHITKKYHYPEEWPLKR